MDKRLENVEARDVREVELAIVCHSCACEPLWGALYGTLGNRQVFREGGWSLVG